MKELFWLVTLVHDQYEGTFGCLTDYDTEDEAREEGRRFMALERRDEAEYKIIRGHLVAEG